MMMTLGEIAGKIGAECFGNSDYAIEGIADLTEASASHISFVTRADYLPHLEKSSAGAVIISAKLKPEADGNYLVMDNPYLGYALTAQLFDTTPRASDSIHPSAVIAADAQIGNGVTIGANSVVESGAVIGDNADIGANCFIGKNSQIGEDSKLWPNVTVYHDVRLGRRGLIHSGTALGSDGFGFANDSGEWIKIPQIGGVVIGDDFECGANCTIDRGALRDTCIGDCVKLDNMVHIAHNVTVGDGTAMAATTGVAGGTVIGKGCTFAGRVSVIGHLNICDNVHLTVGTILTKSIDKPGIYSSGDAAQPNRDWKRQVVRMRNLDDLMNRVKALEKKNND